MEPYLHEGEVKCEIHHVMLFTVWPVFKSIPFYVTPICIALCSVCLFKATSTRVLKHILWRLGWVCSDACLQECVLRVVWDHGSVMWAWSQQRWHGTRVDTCAPTSAMNTSGNMLVGRLAVNSIWKQKFNKLAAPPAMCCLYVRNSCWNTRLETPSLSRPHQCCNHIRNQCRQ